MMRSGNPALKTEAFRTTNWSQQEVMTEKGTYQKTALLLILCVWAASFTWSGQAAGLVLPAFIAGFILAMVTIFKKQWAMFTAPLYAICEGAALGAISFSYQAQYEGIVFNAVALTFSVMAVMLGLYRFNIIKMNDRVRMSIMAATGGIALVYIVSLIMSFFGASIPMIHDAGPVGIGFSLLVVGIAAFNLLMDFDFIERTAAQRNSPKYMEWYGAFALMVTLVWLYLEMLRLLSKMNRR